MNSVTLSTALGLVLCMGCGETGSEGSQDTGALTGGAMSSGRYEVIYSYAGRDCFGAVDGFYDTAGPTTWELERFTAGDGFEGLELETGWTFECALEDACYDCTPAVQRRDWNPEYDAVQTITMESHGHWESSSSFTGELIYDTSCEGSGCALLAYDTQMLEGFPCIMAHWVVRGTLLD